jgi:hypothetical protein
MALWLQTCSINYYLGDTAAANCWNSGLSGYDCYAANGGTVNYGDLLSGGSSHNSCLSSIVTVSPIATTSPLYSTAAGSTDYVC